MKSDIILQQPFVKNEEVIGFEFVPGELLGVRQNVFVVSGIEVNGHAYLAGVADTVRPLGGSLGAGQSGKQQARQYGNNGDDY